MNDHVALIFYVEVQLIEEPGRTYCHKSYRADLSESEVNKNAQRPEQKYRLSQQLGTSPD